jgi:hypothetical protein
MSGVVMTTGIVALAAMVALMGLFIVFSYWYLRQIRDGRIDLRNDPLWSPYSAPASPHSLLDHYTSMGQRLEDDEYVDHPPEDSTRGLQRPDQTDP